MGNKTAAAPIPEIRSSDRGAAGTFSAAAGASEGGMTPAAPCPWCGSKVDVWTAPGGSWVSCSDGQECGAMGPIRATEEQAIAEWSRIAQAAQRGAAA